MVTVPPTMPLVVANFSDPSAIPADILAMAFFSASPILTPLSLKCLVSAAATTPGAFSAPISPGSTFTRASEATLLISNALLSPLVLSPN